MIQKEEYGRSFFLSNERYQCFVFGYDAIFITDYQFHCYLLIANETLWLFKDVNIFSPI